MNKLRLKRQLVNFIMLSLSSLIAIAILLLLTSILYYLFKKGFLGLSWHTISTLTSSPGNKGGLLNPILGSLLLSGTCILMSAPIGILIGIFMAEYGKKGVMSLFVKYTVDILLGAPAIIFGLFVYEIIVIKQGHFSGWAGVIALSFISIPITAKTTESIYLLVPCMIKEAIYSLGATRARVVGFIIKNIIKGALVSAVLLSFARVIGEAAPLLFTTLNNQFWNINMNKPIASIPVVIFNYALSPFKDWQELAWTASLLITLIVLFTNIIGRFVFKNNPYG